MQNRVTPAITMRPLRLLLLADAALLAMVGLMLILAPRRTLEGFHFAGLPAGVGYMVSLWGCALATMSAGYFVAALDPLKHRIWIQVGIARGALQCAVGAVWLAQGVITFQQAGFGLVAAALVTAGYIILYPRKRSTSGVGLQGANADSPNAVR